MGEGIFVGSTDVLEALGQAWSRASSDVMEALDAVDAATQRAVERLDERRRECEQEIRCLRRRLDEADEDEDTGHLADCLEDAMDRRRIAVSSLRQVEDAYGRHKSHARRAQHLATDQADKVKAFLQQRLEELQDYFGVRVDGGGGYAEADGLAGLVAGVSALAGGSASASQGASAPDNQLSTGSYAWMDPRAIPLAELDEGALSWGKLSRETAQRSLEAIQRLRPQVNLDAMTSERQVRAQRDELEALSTETGQRTLSNEDFTAFDMFFGIDAIRIDVKGEEFCVINGRHRLWMSLVLGMHSVPVLLSDGAKRLLQRRIEGTPE